MSWLSGQRKTSVAHQSQRIVAQMHEILQSKNAKIDKLEIVINELQDACLGVLEEEVESLRRYRQKLEDEMAAIDELIRSKSDKLADLREETAKITSIVNEDDITKAVEVLRKSSKRRAKTTTVKGSAKADAEGGTDIGDAHTATEEESKQQHDDSNTSASRLSNSDSSVPTYQQLLEEHEIRSEISAEDDDFESLDSGADALPDGTLVDHSTVIHCGAEGTQDHTDEDVIEGLELLSTLRETDASIMFVIHRDAVDDVAGVSIANPGTNPSLDMYKFDCEQPGWPREEIKFLERSTFYRFTPLAPEAGYVFMFQLSLLPDRVISVSKRSEEQYVCHTTIAGVDSAILDRVFVSSKSTWGFSFVGTVDLFGRNPETGVLLHERFKVWENAQQSARPAP